VPPYRLPTVVRTPIFRLLVAAILVVGCGGSTSSPIDVSGTWQLTGGTVDGAPFPVVPDAPVTLSVASSEIGGRSPCNHYGGRIVVDDNGSRFEMTSMTAMACEEPVMAAEAIFIAALPRVRGATRDGDRLTLSGPGVELTFDRLPPVPVADIVGTEWILESLVSGDVASSVAGEPATLRLEAGGTFSGSTGCRTFSGRWVLANGGISPTDLGMEGECPAELTEQDGHIVGVLEGFRASVDGQRLTLTGERGDGLIYRAD
jgi:heat shock protein HslJ